MTLHGRLSTLEASGLIRLAAAQPELEYLFRHALVQPDGEWDDVVWHLSDAVEIK